MPSQLLSPAGLPALDVFGESGVSSPIGEDDASLASSSSRQYLDVSLPGVGSSRRIPLKRTASTASVNDHIMDMLNPHKQAEEIARMNGHSRKGRSSSVLSSDSDDGIGTIEDWEIEQDSPVAESNSKRRQMEEEQDPFTVTPPVSAPSMMLDPAGPSSSPTLALRKQRRPASTATLAQDSDDDMDDADNNPFLSASTAPPKAPKKSAIDHKKKISYVFRGKRVTYDAPLDSLFQDDEDEESSIRMKSGPRVLFPSPPTPAPAPPTAVQFTPRKQAYLSPEARTPISLHLMQTPRRQPHVVADSSNASDVTLVASSDARGNSKPEGDRKQAPIAPFIPPTPASLPQKSQKSDEQRRLERERLQNAMSGIHAAHQAVHNAHRGEGAAAAQQRQRRYAPYPPR